MRCFQVAASSLTSFCHSPILAPTLCCYGTDICQRAVSFKAAASEVDILLASASSGQGGLVHVVDKVLSVLEESGLSYMTALPIRSVGCDPANRDGFGLSGENVHALGSDIVFMGFSWGEVRQPVCIEEAPGSSFIAQYNVDLVSGSPLLPQVLPDSIRYGPLSCSTTHMFLRCVEEAMPSDMSGIIADGNLSLDMLSAKDKEFAKA